MSLKADLQPFLLGYPLPLQDWLSEQTKQLCEGLGYLRYRVAMASSVKERTIYEGKVEKTPTKVRVATSDAVV